MNTVHVYFQEIPGTIKFTQRKKWWASGLERDLEITVSWGQNFNLRK